MGKYQSGKNSFNRYNNSAIIKNRKLVFILALLCIVPALIKPFIRSYVPNHSFNKIRKTTEAIFEEEMEYFKKRGRFTADLKKITLPLPPQDETAPNEYERSHYEYDENQGPFYVAETLMYYTKSGDHYLISISEEQLSDTSTYPPINYFSVTGFGKNLPVAFNKAYGYGTEYQRQFNRPSSSEITIRCYAAGAIERSEEARRICQKAGIPFEAVVVVTP